MDKALEQYPKLADSLDSIHECMQVIGDHRQMDVKKQTMNIKVVKALIKLLELYEECEPKDHRKFLGDQISHSKGGYIFTEYLRALTKSGNNIPTDGYDFECCRVLQNVCWNYTDASTELAAELGTNGLFPLLVTGINNFRKDFDKENIRCNIILPCISILHNSAKVWDNKKYFKEANVVDAVAPYVNVNEPEIKMISLLLLSYVIEEKDNHIITTDGSILKFIFKYLKGAIESEDHRFEGFSTHEVVSGIMHLANNDENKCVIVNEGILPMLVKLMRNGNEDEKSLCAMTVWILSFREENRGKIKKEPDMVEMLKKLKQSSGDAKINAAGALWKLEQGAKTKQVRQAVPPRKGPPPLRWGKRPTNSSVQSRHVMISYHWDQQDLASKIYERLQSQNYRVWLASGGSTLQTMTEAVENSVAVVVCASQRYEESPNCRTEAEYALKLRKPITLVRAEARYTPYGWVEELAETDCIDLSDEMTLREGFQRLIRQIGQRGKITDAITKSGPKRGPTGKATEPKSLSNWTKQRVQQWARSNSITSPKIANLDGESLSELHNMNKTAPEFFYKYASEQLGMKEIRDITLLRKALDRLGL